MDVRYRLTFVDNTFESCLIIVSQLSLERDGIQVLGVDIVYMAPAHPAQLTDDREETAGNCSAGNERKNDYS